MTRRMGFTYFGLQFFGECWSGVKPNAGYDNDGNSSAEGCVGKNLTMPCEHTHPVCVGKGNRNYVYKLVKPTPKPGKYLLVSSRARAFTGIEPILICNYSELE